MLIHNWLLVLALVCGQSTHSFGGGALQCSLAREGLHEIILHKRDLLIA